jgi:rRNA-processing protein FCF1
MEKIDKKMYSTLCTPTTDKQAFRLQKRQEKQAKVLALKDKINYIQSKEGFNKSKDNRIVKALEKNNLDVEKAMAFLALKESHISELKDKRAKRRQEDMIKFQVKDIDELKELKKKLRQEKRVKVESVKESPNDKEQRLEIIRKALYDDKVISTVILDGNNMLFVNDIIRKECLSRHTKKGEIMLGNISFEYAKVVGLKDCLLVFDQTNQVYSKSSEGVQFKVTSAYPEFKSSDDAFVEMAGGMNAELLSKTLFVTSDRELSVRLKEKNVSYVMKSGEFIKETEAKINKELYASLLA